MRSILGIFGRSPFIPIKSHMEMIASCFALVKEEIDATLRGDFASAARMAASVNEKQNRAEGIKAEITRSLQNSFFLAIDKGSLFEMLAIQSQIAERCYDAAIILTHKQSVLPALLKNDFDTYVLLVASTFQGAEKIINELNDLLETSFGGLEAEKVKHMIDTVLFDMDKTETQKRTLLSGLLNASLPYSDFYIWEKCTRYLSGVANLSAHLASLVKTTLDVKG